MVLEGIVLSKVSQADKNKCRKINVKKNLIVSPSSADLLPLRPQADHFPGSHLPEHTFTTSLMSIITYRKLNNPLNSTCLSFVRLTAL